MEQSDAPYTFFGQSKGLLEEIRWFIPSVPSVIMGNVPSLPNEMRELKVLTRLQREGSIMWLTETWLSGRTPLRLGCTLTFYWTGSSL